MRVPTFPSPVVAVLAVLASWSVAPSQAQSEASAGKVDTQDQLLCKWLEVRNDAEQQYERLAAYRDALKGVVDVPILPEIGMRTFTDTSKPPASEELQKQVDTLFEQWNRQRGPASSVHRLLPWLLRFELLGQNDIRIAYSLVEAWGVASPARDAKQALEACKQLEDRVKKEITAAQSTKSTAALTRLSDQAPAMQWDESALEGGQWLLKRLEAWRAKFENGESIAGDQLVADRVADAVEAFRAAVERDDNDAMQRVSRRVSKHCGKQLDRLAPQTRKAVTAMIGYPKDLEAYEDQQRKRAAAAKSVADLEGKIETAEADRDRYRKQKEDAKKKRDKASPNSRDYQKWTNEFSEAQRRESEANSKLRTYRELEMPRARKVLDAPRLDRPTFDPS
ncbi:MAG TPA: hypothetical protein VF384_03465 [Planctomycetota bacterium]